MKLNNYHPIRQKGFWVAVIQAVVTLAGYFGVEATDAEPIVTALVAILNVFVLFGVLYKGTVDAEKNTTPLDDEGVPLNPKYNIID